MNNVNLETKEQGKQGLGQKLKQSLQSVANKTYHYARCFVVNTYYLFAVGIAAGAVCVLTVAIYLSNPISTTPLDRRVDRAADKLEAAARKFLEK